MQYLFFDTETTGVPRNYKAPITDLENWPRLVQIAWVVFNENGEKDGGLFTECNYLIKPEGFTIPDQATAVHGITTEKAISEGHSLVSVLAIFHHQLGLCEKVAGHNVMFDINVVGAEFLRSKLPAPNIAPLRIVDTMLRTTQLCRLPGPYGFKWPTLTELHQFVFGEPFEGAHDALADITATARCFFELRKRGKL